jgi:hypothetical protein
VRNLACARDSNADCTRAAIQTLLWQSRISWFSSASLSPPKLSRPALLCAHHILELQDPSPLLGSLALESSTSEGEQSFLAALEALFQLQQDFLSLQP